MKKRSSNCLTIVLIVTLVITLTSFSDTAFRARQISNNPTSASDEITLVTPENKTYTSAMNGYYPGSFGFENDLPGVVPEGWWTRSAGDGYYEVDSLLAGHNNVYEIRKSGGTTKVETYNIFPQGTTVGTIEFWVYKDTDSGIDPTRITLRDDPTGGYIPFGIENGDLFIGAWSEKIYTYSNVFAKNVWHHIRVDFNLAIGWQLQLDDTWYGSGYAFDVYASDHPDPSQINTFHVESIYSGDNPSYGAWFDAVSYSWDPNYNIGDNLEEGLLVSYSTSFEPDWQAYSLDGQTNITILGNTTINLPEIGLHSMKISCNSTLGDLFFSEMRYFSIGLSSFELSTPENKTYTSAMNGYYPGSFGFENDLPGAIPEGWWTRSTGDGYYEVDSLLAGHNNVYEIRKSGGTTKVETYNIFPQGTTVGTIEFWVYKDTDSGIDPTRITLRDDPTGGYIPFGIENGDLFIGAWSEKIYVYNNVFTKNVWHHIRVDFNLAIGWQLQLDDTWYGAGYGFDVYATDHPDPSQINTFHVESIYSGDNPSYGAWFDAVSYSWDPNYNIGDNTEEGLLVSYSTSFDPDWQAYSLDGQANVTIIGDTTITMPDDGVHYIQVFANTSIGFWVQTEIRFFTINLNAPEIIINVPIENTFYSIDPPNFSLIIDEPFLSKTWYSLDGGLTNFEFTGLTGSINQLEWDELEDGPIILTFFANDTLGRIGSAYVLVNKDVNAPNIDILLPGDEEYYSATAPTFSLTITEPFLSKTWYSLDGGLTNFEFTGLTGSINQLEWDELEDGPIILTFFANDTLGRISSAYVLVNKDANAPVIDVVFPEDGDYYSATAPIFNLSIIEPHLNSTWYTIDGGHNIPFYTFTEALNQAEWNMLSDGPVTIRFYANDSLGQTSYSEILINKDATDPELTINQPFDLAKFTGPPIFNLTIIEANIESRWYTLNGGVDTYMFTNHIGAIDSLAWAALPDGPVIIRFYVRDLAGNQVYQEVTVIKKAPTVPPAIPGYNIYMLLGLLSLTALILTRKKTKS